MYYPEKLKQRRQELGFKQVEIARELGISKQSYFAWEKGTTQPNKANLTKLENLLDVPTGYFNELEIATLYKKLTKKNQDVVLNYVNDLIKQQTNVIPIKKSRFAYKVYERLSAGVGTKVYEDMDYDLVYFDKELAHDFASWIEGDSMEPTYHKGSVALIRETGFDYDGAVYAVVWNSETYIKKVYREENGLRLVSINKDYEDKFAPYEDNPRIVGKIVGSFMPIIGG